MRRWVVRRSRRLWPRLAALSGSCLFLATFALVGVGRGQITNIVGGQQPMVFDQVVGQPMGLPHLPPQGAWGEVINVTSRWIVLQNHTGQQFPVAIDDIGEFLVRWPTGLDVLTNQSMVEAVGRDLGNNVLQTEHVDVFEGADRTLVAPTYNSLLPNNALLTTIDPGFNRLMSPWDYAGQNMLYGWAYPVRGGYSGIPSRLHVVGNAINRSPLQLGIPGNNIATVVPFNEGGLSLTQVTRGNIAHVRKGDYAFMMPQQIGQRGLILSQLVLYKKLPFRQFNPAAIR
jgi:hypothetical protein